MPELPEVEFARRAMVRWFKGRSLVKAEATKTRTFRSGKREAFAKLRGPLTRADRRGKYLLLGFGDNGVVAHFGMTGKLVKRPSGHEEPYSRARFVLDSGDVIHFRDPRMFGEIQSAKTSKLDELPSVHKLGRDPMVDGLNGPELKEALGKTKLDLKVALMDQTRLAGLGNIHAAEALFRARIHPGRKAASLSDAEFSALAKAIHETLAFGLDHKGEEIPYVEEPGAPNPFWVYGHAGEKCRRCGTVIKSYVQAGRTTHYCPSCQKKRKEK